jgi:hypothetical protein
MIPPGGDLPGALPLYTRRSGFGEPALILKDLFVRHAIMGGKETKRDLIKKRHGRRS